VNPAVTYWMEVNRQTRDVELNLVVEDPDADNDTEYAVELWKLS
jgi:hypothetical protein